MLGTKVVRITLNSSLIGFITFNKPNGVLYTLAGKLPTLRYVKRNE